MSDRSGVGVDGARFGVCIDHRWRFPFETGTPVESQSDWQDQAGSGICHSLATKEPAGGLGVQWHCVIYHDQPMARLWCTLSNESDQAIKLDALHLLETAASEGSHVSIPALGEDLVVFTDSGSSHFSGVSRLLGESFEYDEKWLNFCPAQSRDRMLGLTKRPELGEGDHASPSGVSVFEWDQAALLFSVLPARRALTTILCRGDEPGVEYLAASSGLFGYELPPGADLESEELLLAVCEDGLTALKTYAETAAALREIRIPRPAEEVPSGWISWYGYRLDMTEEDVLANARVVRDRFLDYGTDVIQLDNGWQRDYCSTEWRETNDNFPHGLTWLSEQIEQMGLRIGFWGNPIMVSSQSDEFKQHPEYLLHDTSGEPVDVGEWVWGAREMMYVLDPTRPEAMDAVSEEIRWMRETTNCRYWKFDFIVHLMSLHRKLKFADPSMVPGIETYHHAIKTMRKVVEDDYVYLCSNFPFAEWGVGDTTSTAPDIGNPCFDKHHHADQRVYQTQHFRQNATTILSRHFLHKRLTLLNPDTANVGTGSLREARMRVSLVAFSGGQFFVGDRLPEYSEERLDLVEKGMPIYGESATPIDLFKQPFPGHPQIWHLPVVTPWDTWDVVCLVNINESGDITIDLNSVFPGRKDMLLFDFWEESPLGTLDENPAFTLEATESKVIGLREPRAHPHLLATDMHLTQGAVEVLQHDWSAADRTLSLQFRRRPGARGKFWVQLPQGFDGDCELESQGGKAELILSSDDTACISLAFDTKEMTCKLSFN